MTPDGEEQVFRALANPHRRRILDRLAKGPLTTGEIAAEFEDELTRFAVMQHLGVLEDADLVLVRREGRKRFNFLNAVPIREVYERWVSEIAGETASASVALKKFVEQKGSRHVEQRANRANRK